MKRVVTPEPIAIEAETLKKEIVVLTAVPSSADIFNELSLINDDETKPVGDRLLLSMSKIFGGEPEDYKKFDFRVIKGVIDIYNEEMASPTKTQNA